MGWLPLFITKIRALDSNSVAQFLRDLINAGKCVLLLTFVCMSFWCVHGYLIRTERVCLLLLIRYHTLDTFHASMFYNKL